MKVSRIRNLRTRPFGWVAKPGWTQWTKTIADWFLLKFDCFSFSFILTWTLIGWRLSYPAFVSVSCVSHAFGRLAKRNRCRSKADSSWKTTIKLWVISEVSIEDEQKMTIFSSWKITAGPADFFLSIFLAGQNTGTPNDCFLWNICSKRQILSRIFYYSRTDKKS